MPGPISTNEISSDLQAGPLASLCSVATARTLIPLALLDTYSGGQRGREAWHPLLNPQRAFSLAATTSYPIASWLFSFFKIILCIPGIFCVDDTLLWQCFILFHFERRRGGGGMPSVSRASRWKSESVGEKPMWFWKKTTLSPCSGIVLTGKKWGKLRKAGFSQSSHFKVYLFDSFISQTQCKFKANTTCFQTPLPCFNYPLWTCYRASYWSYSQKKEDSPQRPHFCNAEEINSKGRVKESADLKGQGEAETAATAEQQTPCRSRRPTTPAGRTQTQDIPQRTMTLRTTLVLRKSRTESGVPMCQGIPTWPTAQM